MPASAPAPFVYRDQVSNPLILVVDDSDPLRSAIRELICASMLSASCIEASTGEDAVRLVEELPPWLVVMDLKLPGMNGIVATRRIKAMLPLTHVVIVSLLEAARFQAEATEAGALAFLPKRVLHRELIPLLARLLEGDAGMPSERTSRLQAIASSQ